MVHLFQREPVLGHLGDHLVQTVTDDEAEAQRGTVTHLKSHSKSVIELGLEPALPSARFIASS